MDKKIGRKTTALEGKFDTKFNEMETEFKESNARLENKIDDMMNGNFERLGKSLEASMHRAVLDLPKRSSMTGKEKVILYTTLITSIASIIVAIISVVFG